MRLLMIVHMHPAIARGLAALLQTLPDVSVSVGGGALHPDVVFVEANQPRRVLTRLRLLGNTLEEVPEQMDEFATTATAAFP
jgi:hypothetical protein